MAAVTAGTKIVIRGTGRPVVLRALRPAQLDGGWAVPVMADLAALEDAGVRPGQIEIEVRTDEGTVSLDAEIVRSGDLFLVRAPGLRTAAMTEQRRDDVRAPVCLPVRGSILATHPAGSGTRHDGPQGPAAVLTGMTRTVSGGGLCLVLDELPAGARTGARLYLELTMPGGDLAPAVLRIVSREPVRDGVLVRARFDDISPLDSERLVRMVFTRQRTELAERRAAVRPLGHTN
jgi:c-di-GMP-binding flagellar brake protein YcgR